MGSTVNEAGDESSARGAVFFEHPRYVDLGPISSGACGDVRQVRDTHLSCTLAMKVTRRCIDPESPTYARFMTEIDIMTSLRHPGILPALDSGGFADGRLWLTMPEVRGRTYAVLLDEFHNGIMHGDFRSHSLRHALEAFARLCDIVAYSHERGIVHRDLKPKNMMVADGGETFVIDWGVAKRPRSISPAGLPNDTLQKRQAYTEPGEVLGTPAYMPPEQAVGDIFLQSPASDVYALGAILYHLLAGKPPYQGTRAAVMIRIKRGPPPPISVVVGPNRNPPAELVALSEAAMERSVSKRQIGARQIAQTIQQWLDSHN